MNPTATNGNNQQGVIPFTEAHNQIYNSLRNVLQQYHASQVPGLDKVVDTLNKQHVAMMQNYVGNPQNTERPRTVPAPSGRQLQGLSDLMTHIRTNTQTPMPSGYGAYNSD